MHTTVRVCVPGPQVVEHKDHAPLTHVAVHEPLLQAWVVAGFVPAAMHAASGTVLDPIMQTTVRVCVPGPHDVEQELNEPATHEAEHAKGVQLVPGMVYEPTGQLPPVCTEQELVEGMQQSVAAASWGSAVRASIATTANRPRSGAGRTRIENRRGMRAVSVDGGWGSVKASLPLPRGITRPRGPLLLARLPLAALRRLAPLDSELTAREPCIQVIEDVLNG
jgi:hypothetical protein